MKRASIDNIREKVEELCSEFLSTSPDSIEHLNTGNGNWVYLVSHQDKAKQLYTPTTHGYVSKIGDAAPFSNWYDFLVDRIPKHLPEDSFELNSIRSFLLESQEHFENLQPQCFFDDLTVKNVLVHNNKLSGFIDFDGVCYGDPLLQTGLTIAGISVDHKKPDYCYIECLLMELRANQLERQTAWLYGFVDTLNIIQESGADIDLYRDKLRRLMNNFMPS